MLEEGRFHNIERHIRLGQFCNMNMVEDEFHFVFVCPAFRDLQKRYIVQILLYMAYDNKVCKMIK